MDDCSRYLDTSLIDVDVQPTYVRVTVKGKVRHDYGSHPMIAEQLNRPFLIY